MKNWFHLLALCLLTNSLLAQQNVQIKLNFPDDLNVKGLQVQFNNGKTTVPIPLDASSNSLAFDQPIYAVYGIVEVYYPGKTPGQPYKQSFLIQENQPATITFITSEVPLAKFDLTNATDLNDAGKRDFQAFMDPAVKEFQHFFAVNGEGLNAGNDSLQQLLSQKILGLNSRKLEFIQANPDAYYSFLIFKDEVIKSKLDAHLLIDTYQNTFLTSIQNSWPGQQVMTFLNGKILKAGDAIPAITSVDVNGKPISLNTFKNKKHVLLIFWATWCQFCAAEIPDMKEIQQTYAPRGLEVISISHDFNEQALRKGIEKHQLNWTHVFNQPEVSNQLAITAVPSFYLIDPQGKILFKEEGLQKDRIDELKTLLGATL